MTKFRRSLYAKCPLKGCGEDLIVIVHDLLYVNDEPMPKIHENTYGNASQWSVECADGHVLDSGGEEMDGRSLVVGYRRAQILGGLR